MTLDSMQRLDPDGMYDAICSFPDQLTTARGRAQQVVLTHSVADFDHVVVIGMGGSAIGGDLLRTFALDEAEIPIFVSRSYRLPSFVGPSTLVIASSYSGNTEETLSGLATAQAVDAPVICITSGGTLQQEAQQHDYPCVVMPGGLQPRAALGYSLASLFTLAEKIELLFLDEDDWNEVHDLLTALGEEYADPARSKARALAERLHGTIPLIYSSEGFVEAVNLRWRGQMEENSKTLSFGNLLPEQNHNEIMGWEQPHPVHEMLSVVVLRDSSDHPRVQRRVEAIRELLEPRAAAWEEVYSRGEGKLSRMLSLLHFGDWVSFYLAMLNEVNPTPVALISELKETIAS